MKQLLKILLLIFAFADISSAEWISQNSGTQYNLVSVKFINENTGWACGQDLVLLTTNSGSLWQQVNVTGTHQGIYFINSSTGYLVSRAGELRRSVNGGNNWQLVNSGVNVDLNSITFLDESAGIITGAHGTVLRTTDGGVSWTPVATPGANIDFYSSYILNGEDLFVIGSEGSIFKSTNSGLSWIDNSLEQPNPFFTIFFINENTGWVAGCCGMYFKTEDGGSSWSPETYLTQGYTISGSKFVSGSKGWMAANGGIILKTSNGGASWFSLTSNSIEDLKSVDFVNENTGWIVGNFGTILKTTNGGGEGVQVGIQNITSEAPGSYSLKQNYPNPFNPSTTIAFDIAKQGDVNIIIYNASGEEVERASYGILNAGSYKIEYNGSGLSSGVYYYRLITNGFSSVKKMVLLK
jgi:photosystem II stability/assembly factor-like uncharacterized protein